MAGLNLFTNNAATTLASGVLIGATSLTVAAGTGAEFPTLTGSEYFYCTIANNAGSVEIIKVTARSTDTFTIVRGQDGTSAAAWASGDKVELRLTRIDLLNFPQLDSTNTFATTQTFTAAPVFTDQAGTRTAMLAAKSAANSDITSLTGLTTPLSVAQGGTGAATLTANNVILGNGTSAVAFVAPGTSGNLLTSNGTTWSSAAPPAGGYKTRNLISGTTYTPTAAVKSFYAFVYGATGGRDTGGNGGNGGAGYSETYYTSPSGSYTYAIGAAGTTSGTAGGTTTFGAMSVTGGAGVTSNTGSSGGVGSGGTFNATGGAGGNGDSSRGGGGGGPGTRAGVGGTGAAQTGSTGGGGGGTGGNNASGATGGAAATTASGSALNLSTTLGTLTQSWDSGTTATSTPGRSGATGTQTQDIVFIWNTAGSAAANGGSNAFTAASGSSGRIMIIELL
jgi:hypothetical protein